MCSPYKFSSGGLCQSGRTMAAPDRQLQMMFRLCWSSSLEKTNRKSRVHLLTDCSTFANGQVKTVSAF